MRQIGIPAVSMRGGTSNALVFHRHDLPPTGALCLAVAARIAGTLPHRHTRPGCVPGADLRLLQPWGVSTVAAEVEQRDGAWIAHQATVYRTQRRLFEGRVLIPAARLGNLARSALARRAA